MNLDEVLRVCNAVMNGLQLVGLSAVLFWMLFMKGHLENVAKLLAQIEQHLKTSVGNVINMGKEWDEIRKRNRNL